MAKDYKKMRGFGKDFKQPQMPRSEGKKLADNTQSPNVYPIETSTEKYDLDRMRYHSVGTKGYARQAFEYDY